MNRQNNEAQTQWQKHWLLGLAKKREGCSHRCHVSPEMGTKETQREAGCKGNCA
jgi:hypothetical protein